ncbi:hypothetical protein [Microtetraspora malaysiensis]|uniref:Uncharacterized protein n=1 Tax=Microtetraspora malaysiensis TaxID=161358 RepID=A0ABW6SKJ9_9ACTN
MADTSYLCLGGVEISNAARVAAYTEAGLKPHTANVGDCGCDGLTAALGDDPYTLPGPDEAPWVDPAEPASLDFAGLMILDITGLDAAPMQRAITNRIGDGAVIGRKRRGPRTITVTGVLIGRTACSVDYGLRWLSSALEGSLGCGPGAGCSGDDLDYLTCCPTVPSDDCCPQPCTDGACAVDAFRTLRDVALTSAPEVTRRIGGCSCCPGQMLQVQFELTAGRPHALRSPKTIAEAVTWPPPSPDDECVKWSTDPGCLDEAGECAAQQPQPCPLDPSCPQPVVPELPLPTNPCLCEPWERRQVCITIPPATAPIWADMVPLLEVYAGSSALRGIRVRFYANPTNVPVDELDPCSWCSEINISYLPEYARLILDGSRRSASVQCPGRAETPASGIVSGASGRPFQWPVLECGIPYTVCVSADSSTVADDATVTLRTIVREV